MRALWVRRTTGRGTSGHRAARSVAVAGLTAAVVSVAAVAQAAITPTTPEPGPAPVVARTPTLPAGTSAVWQTSDSVWALAFAKGTTATAAGTLYAGGDFTSVRAPGTAAGDVSQRAAGRIAAFNATTGAPVTTFNHTTDARVQAIAVSADGRTLYIGGLFQYVDGKKHPKVAAFDLTKVGAPLLAWNPNVATGSVRAITTSADSTSVVLGGDFATVGGVAQPRLAKVAATTGALDATWKPTVDRPVNALLVTPDKKNVIAGGMFEYANGVHHRAIASFSVTGATLGPLDDVMPTCGVNCAQRTDVKALVTDGTTVYVANEGTGGGWFDGTWAFDPITGKRTWLDNCLGATQAVAVIKGVVYGGSHAHDCTAVGGFGNLPYANGTPTWHHLMAEQASDGTLLDWFPTTDPGPTNGVAVNELGPRAMATDGTTLFLGGQFTKVNGAPQRGLARFTPTSPTAKPLAVTAGVAELTTAGSAVLKFPGSSDVDSSTLTYKVYRDGNYAKPIATIGPVWAHFWTAPLLTVRDSGLASGSHYYVVDAIDPTGNVTRSGKFTTTASVGNYATAVLGAKPTTFWKLDETDGSGDGPAAADASGNGNGATYDGAVNLGVAGATPSGTAIHLGPGGHVFSGGPASTVPAVYTAELWLRTTTTTGGRILGFGNSRTGTSSSYDRALWMNDSGQLLFGTYNNATQVAWGNKSYNDGTWHHVVITQDATTGMRLIVDGQQIAFKNSATTAQPYAGWWRLGSDNLNGWPQLGSSAGFVGDIDNVAIYPSATTGVQIRSRIGAE